MRQKLKIAIIGGGGRTGKYLVDQLVNHGHSVKLLLRNPQNINVQNSLIEIVKGDAVDPASIHSLLAGCQAIISTVGQRKDEPLVARQATINVLKAMEAHQIQRYLLVTGLNVDTPFDRKGLQTSMATEWMKTNYSIYHEDKQKAYSILSASDLAWTMVRVPFIEFMDERNELRVSLEDCLGTKISAADIAAFLVDQLDDTTYIRKSPFIANP
jgi:putative NADH-flavin reductase